MINIYKAEISLNGRNSIVEVIDTDYLVNKDMINLVRRVLMNSFSLEYEQEVYVYLHYKNLKK
jgi:hypothetical protein